MGEFETGSLSFSQLGRGPPQQLQNPHTYASHFCGSNSKRIMNHIALFERREEGGERQAEGS